MKHPIPRMPQEIIHMLGFLELKRIEMLNAHCPSGALALGAQIELLKWAYNLGGGFA